MSHRTRWVRGSGRRFRCWMFSVLAITAVAAVGGCSTGSSGPTATVTVTVTPAPTTTTTNAATTTTAANRTTSPPSVTRATPPAPPSLGTPAPDPISVVQSYFSSINAKNYTEAYRLIGRVASPSFESFVQGFTTTDHVVLTVDGSSGSTVAVAFTAFQTDSSQKRYVGTYTVSQGVITGANIHEITTGAGAAPTGGATSFAGTGTFLVGRDIQPGTYRAPAQAGCYWERDKDTSGTLDSIIANDNADGPVVVTIAPTDAAFKAQGCATFTKIG